MSALVAVLLRSRGLDVATVPEQTTLGKTDREQLEFATSINRCLVTHNRVDFEQLHLQFMQENRKHCGIIVVPQKNAYKVAQRTVLIISYCMHSLVFKKMKAENFDRKFDEGESILKYLDLCQIQRDNSH